MGYVYVLTEINGNISNHLFSLYDILASYSFSRAITGTARTGNAIPESWTGARRNVRKVSAWPRRYFSRSTFMLLTFVAAFLYHPPHFSFRAFKPSASVYFAPDDILYVMHASLLTKLKRAANTYKINMKIYTK